MIFNSPHKNKTQGFTLLELTIAMSLGTVLSMAIVQLFITVKQTAESQQSLMRIQENMQTANFIMGKAIRSAGNMGCIQWQDASSRKIPNDLDLADLGLSHNKVIRVTNVDELRSNRLIVSGVLNRMKANTDVLWVVGSVHNPKKLKENDLVVKADCANIEIFRVGAGLGTSLRAKRGNGPQLRELSSVLYYIGIDNGLHAVDLNDYSEGLIEGVEDLKATLTPNGVRIQFVFSAGARHLAWEQEWAIRA